MRIFKEVGLTWGGEEYKIPPDKVMGLVFSLEEIITLEELTSGTGLKRGKLAQAYQAALMYAGAKVNVEDIYNAFFDGKAAANTTAIVTGLLSLMIPPEHIAKSEPSKTASAPKKKPVKRRAKS